MSSAQRQYILQGRKKVRGWFYRVDAEFFFLLTDYQNRNALDGSVVEIGLHHGQSFIALCLSLREGQRAYGIDIFEQQSLNGDRSGHGDRGRVERNLRAAGVDLSAVVLDGRPSGSVTPADILGTVGAARLFSIDGGQEQFSMSDVSAPAGFYNGESPSSCWTICSPSHGARPSGPMSRSIR